MFFNSNFYQAPGSKSGGAENAPAGYSFVEMFRNAAPYIASHRGAVMTFHIPGYVVSQTKLFQSLMDDIMEVWLLGVKIVIVCGCSAQVDERLKRENIYTEKRRILASKMDVRVSGPEVSVQ